ncbi:MAG: tRNA (adenosine(37)-N6)-threonylcarbamoyltransferase complex ATPase subunit type 1 TsaE [Ruminococcaceae bacterium]|nr:tRNA (adenosine(37)-N6)-threonylcarbamoyltransferase complex ATPase subunit type 1 TsaE [Oscillospiraceae bacterium]
MKHEYFTAGEAETRAVAERLALSLLPGQTVCLRGELGVGKTVFAKGLCAALGVSEHVSSPTFTLVNEYEGTRGSVYHFDLYRIEDADELFEIGFSEFVGGSGISLIEWPERAEEALPKARLDITITREGENGRRILIEEVSA